MEYVCFDIPNFLTDHSLWVCQQYCTLIIYHHHHLLSLILIFRLIIILNLDTDTVLVVLVQSTVNGVCLSYSWWFKYKEGKPNQYFTLTNRFIYTYIFVKKITAFTWNTFCDSMLVLLPLKAKQHIICHTISFLKYCPT